MGKSSRGRQSESMPTDTTAAGLARPPFRSLPSVDRNGLETLDRNECLRLLGAHGFGRVGVTIGAMPVVLPVTYRLIDENVVFRTGAGRKLAAATADTVIAFEIDSMDSMTHSGWSVVVTGVARVIDDPFEVRRLTQLGVPRWAPFDAARFVSLPTDRVSGRRLNPLRQQDADR